MHKYVLKNLYGLMPSNFFVKFCLTLRCILDLFDKFYQSFSL